MPDTYGGALVLIIVNAAVVFVALGVLSLIIRAIHMIPSRPNSQDDNDRLQARQKELAILTGFPSDESFEDNGSFVDKAEGDSSDEISEEVQAVVAAALEAYMSSRESVETPVLLRATKGSGAWGCMSKRKLCDRQRGSLWRCGRYTSPESSSTAGKRRCYGRWI